jgi:hypothetical protein
MRHAHYPESRLEAEVYKFKGFTVNLFIDKGFNQLTPKVSAAKREAKRQ